MLKLQVFVSARVRVSGGRGNMTRHGTTAITIAITIDIDIRHLGGVTALVRLLPRVGRSGSIARRLPIRCGAFSLRRLLDGGGSFNNGRLLLREGPTRSSSKTTSKSSTL